MWDSLVMIPAVLVYTLAVWLWLDTKEAASNDKWWEQ